MLGYAMSRHLFIYCQDHHDDTGHKYPNSFVNAESFGVSFVKNALHKRRDHYRYRYCSRSRFEQPLNLFTSRMDGWMDGIHLSIFQPSLVLEPLGSQQSKVSDMMMIIYMIIYPVNYPYSALCIALCHLLQKAHCTCMHQSTQHQYCIGTNVLEVTKWTFTLDIHQHQISLPTSTSFRSFFKSDFKSFIHHSLALVSFRFVRTIYPDKELHSAYTMHTYGPYLISSHFNSNPFTFNTILLSFIFTT